MMQLLCENSQQLKTVNHFSKTLNHKYLTRLWTKYGKMRSRKTPYLDAFHAVLNTLLRMTDARSERAFPIKQKFSFC